MFKKTIRAVKKYLFTSSDEKTEKKHGCVLKTEKKKNSLLPTLCPIWTSLPAINYPLKYTVEGLSTGWRPGGGKGKMV